MPLFYKVINKLSRPSHSIAFGLIVLLAIIGIAFSHSFLLGSLSSTLAIFLVYQFRYLLYPFAIAPLLAKAINLSPGLTFLARKKNDNASLVFYGGSLSTFFESKKKDKVTFHDLFPQNQKSWWGVFFEQAWAGQACFFEDLRDKEQEHYVYFLQPIIHKNKTFAVAGFLLDYSFARDYESKLQSLKQSIKAKNQEISKLQAQISQLKDTSTLLHHEAQSAQTIKNHFITNVSHEIRTPLNAILGSADLLKESTSLEEQNDYIDLLTQSSNSLLTLVEDLLDFSKLESGVMELASVEFSPIDVLDQVIDSFNEQIIKKGLYCHCAITGQDTPEYTIGDPYRLQQVFVNLLSNAIKFTSKGGIDIQVEYEKLTDDSDQWRFSILDTGVGISESIIPTIFGEFIQEDPSATRSYEGAGLGLSLCKRICTLMGGTIDVISGLGQGSTFTCSIITQSYHNTLLFSERFRFLNNQSVLLISDQEHDNPLSYLSQFAQFTVHTHAWNDSDYSLLQTPSLVMLYSNNPLLIKKDASPLIAKLKQRFGRQFATIISSPHNYDASHLVAIDPSVLWVSSVVTYSAFLFAAKQVASSQHQPQSNSSSPLKFLVVEDDETNQMVHRLTLEKEGCLVHSESSGLAALSAISKGDYDCVIVDIRLPEIDGLELCRRSFAHLACEQRPYVVVVSAYLDSYDPDDLVLPYVDEYLGKPIAINRLQSIIMQLKSGHYYPSPS